MKDKEIYKLLNEFANEHSLAKGGNIKIVISEYNKSFTPKADFMNFEDVQLLSTLIQGAEHFLFWYARKNKKGKL